MIVTIHHSCRGRDETDTFAVADVPLTVLLVPTAFPLASSFVLISTLMPADGIVEVRVTLKGKEALGLSTLLPALCVKATGCSVGGGGGVGPFEPQL